MISSADTFSTLIGATGCLTDPAQAFVLLFRARDVDAFRALAKQASAAPRLYGLCGLKHLAPRDAAALRKHLSSSQDHGAIEMGCEGPGPMKPVSELLAAKDAKTPSEFDAVCDYLVEHGTGSYRRVCHRDGAAARLTCR